MIELQNVQYKKPFEVNLEIRCQSCHSKDKEFRLVLKSPSHVTWRVHTKKVQGYIFIVVSVYVTIEANDNKKNVCTYIRAACLIVLVVQGFIFECLFFYSTLVVNLENMWFVWTHI